MNKSPIFVQKGVIMETMELKSDLVGDFWDELPDEVKNDID